MTTSAWLCRAAIIPACLLALAGVIPAPRDGNGRDAIGPSGPAPQNLGVTLAARRFSLRPGSGPGDANRYAAEQRNARGVSAPRPDLPAAAPLSVAFSSEANGYLAPCGCSSPMIGGFPRRATWLAARAKMGPLVRVDNGDLTEALGRQDELKAETLVDIFSTLKYDALNLGEKDFRLGLPYLQSLQGLFRGALLCANARRRDGSPLFKESVLVTRPVGGKTLRILIVGVLSDRFAPQITPQSPDIAIEPPAAALDRLQGDLAAANVRILLYHGSKAEAEELARAHPSFELIVCAHEGDYPMTTVRVGPTCIVCSGQNGKYVGQARIAAAGQVDTVMCSALGPELADDPRIVQLKAAYLDRVTAEDLLGKVPRSPTLDGDSYAGSEACATCHAEPYRVWRVSKHAHALQTLADLREDKDPECVSCHVVGLNRVSGFASRAKTPNLASVGCEGCHGVASRHVRDPKTSLPKVDQSACTGCHNPQNSPRFDFTSYWPRIRH